MTFSTSVELPGVTLPPGAYEFQLADTPQRNVVQVYRAGDRQSWASGRSCSRSGRR
jgi:hypothetical protein